MEFDYDESDYLPGLDAHLRPVELPENCPEAWDKLVSATLENTRDARYSMVFRRNAFWEYMVAE